MRIPFSTRSPYTGGKNPVRKAFASGRLLALGGLVLLVAWPRGAMAGDQLPTQDRALAAPLDHSDPSLDRSWGSLWGQGQDRPLRLGLARLALPWQILLPTTPFTLSVSPDAASSSLRFALPRSSAEDGAAPQSLGTFANLDMTLRGRGELGGDWTRFRPCEAGVLGSCEPSLFPQLKPDIQFGVRLTGTVSDRIHVDVDYDETREFSAANNINIYYQGLEGEAIQRVEVGDVSLALPESRFLTEGVPAGNFGFRAAGGLGPLDFQAVWAQQNGDISSREFRLQGTGAQQAFVQEDTLILDDADYVRGQFFFLLDPREMIGYPHLDVLSLDPSVAPPASTPGPEPVQLYRFENEPVVRQQVEGYIQADAFATFEGDTVVESGWFRYLEPGVDYFLHPSGLWISLRSPLRQDEMLAVTFVTATGDTVGDYNPERIHNAGEQPRLRLLKASGPKHQPDRPTWDLEMHQVYRVSGSNDVEASSVELTISLGELSAGRTFKRRPTGEDITFLKLMGVDEESPIDRLDGAYVYRPAQESFQDQPPVSGTFVIFPTLRPFMEPPPIPSLGLTASATGSILGADANRRIYESADPFERDNGGLFRLTLPYRIRSEGVISSFSLGALGIRDSSEKIYLGERPLEAGTDYTIDYDVGQVTLLNAETLFLSAPGEELRATWEQKSVFRTAPTSVFGFNTGYDLGERGAIHLLGLYQSEKTLVNRPQLGMEPSAITLGGVNGDLHLRASWLDRLLDRVPGLTPGDSSRLDIVGEMALSLPNPNTRDDVFLDDFDATNYMSISSQSSGWRLGSAPAFRDGAEMLLPAFLDQTDATGLVWQHSWVEEGTSGDSTGVFEGLFPRRDIDKQINIAGAESREPVLHFTFGDPRGGALDQQMWRSVTTVLSNTGMDLTKSEYIEFYAAAGDSLAVVIDLGTVSEDALFATSAGAVTGVKDETGEQWGLGRLDQEADPRLGEIWSDVADQRGVWEEECVAERGRVYPRGDPRANCTRGNGRNDTEDLDGNGNLGTDERYYRYVIPLDGSSSYVVRSRQETGTQFRLYRIPLRGPGGINVAGRVTEAGWRAVKHLRLTMVGSRSEDVTVARMRIIGVRWVKRAQEGILQGISGEVRGVGGRVEVGPVSALTKGSDYQPPPGVLEELDDPTTAFSGQAVEFNEKSLAIRYEDIGPGERVEVYNRFPQRPRNFLTYRQARLWVVAPAGDWGQDRPLHFYLKVGNDSENFYLYRTRLESSASEGQVIPADWLPEVRVDFERWLALRRVAEEQLILDPPTPGSGPLIVWSADSTYAVVLKDRARAPNLAAVRELSLGVLNEDDLPASGEIWIDELRLSGAVRDPGMAGYLSLDLSAAEVLTSRVTISGRGAFFRQLEAEPSYLDDRVVSVNSTLQLGRFAPSEWGLSLPLVVSHSESDQDPTFLSQSDVRGDQLPGLRETASSRTRVDISFRKETPTSNAVLGALLGGLDLRVGYSRTRSSTVTLENESDGVDARVGYNRDLPRRDLPVVPGFLGGIVRALLPESMENSVLDGRVRWTPERLSVESYYFRRENEALRYQQILLAPEDALVVPTLSPRRGMESTAAVAFRPFEALTADLSFHSIRDLLTPGKAVQDPLVQTLLQEERLELGPLDLGWETNRRLQTRFGFRPRLTSWLRTDLSVATLYSSDRNATLVELTPTPAGDTVRELQRSANGQRDARLSVTLDPSALVLELVGDTMQEVGSFGATFRSIGSAFDPLSFTWQDGITSRFNRQVVDPGAGFQFGWAGYDDFLVVDGESAATLTDRTAWTAGSGVSPLPGLRLTANYMSSLATTLDTRSDRRAYSRTWPDVRARIQDVTIPSFLQRLVSGVSLTSGFRRTIREATYGGSGLQRRIREDREIPLDLSVRWLGAVSTTYRGSYVNGDGRDPTGDTERQRRSHILSLTSSFSAPARFANRLDQPLQLTFGCQYTAQRDCRATAGRESCTAFMDQIIKSLNLTLDTTVSLLQVGLQLSYTDRRSFVGRRSGSTQFQLGFFGQFLFENGQLTGI